MLVAVVVTFSAAPADLDRCLASIVTGGGVDHVIVVDTGGSAAPTVPGVEVVRTRNDGYGAAANLGASRARELGATAVALLNDDVVVRPGWLDLLVPELVGDVGAAQPKLLLADTDPPLVNSLGVRLDRHGAGSDIGDGDVDRPPGPAHDIELFTGGAVVFSSAFLAATGGFDERYFLYYEDVDLGRRGAALGWRFRCAPAAVVEHVRGGTTSAVPARTRFLQERNRLWCAARWADRQTLARAFWLSVRRLRHRPRGTHAKALAAGLLGTPARLVERRRGPRGDGPGGHGPEPVSRPAGPPPLPPATRVAERTDGVNLVGYFRRQSGISNVAHSAAAALAAHDVPHSIVAFDRTPLPLLTDPPVLDQRLAFRDSIVFVNGDQFALVREELPEVFGPGRRVAGVWFWELETLDGALPVDATDADELWAATSFMARTFEGLGPTPVVVAPLPFRRPTPSTLGRPDFEPLRDAGERFVFGVVLDHLSVTARKNPVGAIEAFRQAFEPGAGPMLVVKTINADACPDDHARLVAAADGRDDVVVWDRHLPLDDHHALMRSFDALVSLHRSEGLGLHLAEAMWMGVPVIASRYSGNLDFMDDGSAMLIDVELVPVGELGGWAYPASARWAAPDLDRAAEAMRRLAADPELARSIGAAGHDRIAAAPGTADFARWVRDRFGLAAGDGGQNS